VAKGVKRKTRHLRLANSHAFKQFSQHDEAEDNYANMGETNRADEWQTAGGRLFLESPENVRVNIKY